MIKKCRNSLFLVVFVIVLVLMCQGFRVFSNNKVSKTPDSIAADFIKKKGYSIVVNSGFAFKINLPKDFSEFETNSKMKKLLASCNLKKYSDKSLTVVGFEVKKKGKSCGTYIVFMDNSQIVANFLDTSKNEEYVKLLRDMFYNDKIIGESKIPSKKVKK